MDSERRRTRPCRDDWIKRRTPARWAAAVGLVACAPLSAQDRAPAAPAADDIVVTARRSDEKLADVPVAVSVVTPATIEARGPFSPVDLAASVPGLTVNASIADRNNLTYTIRGQGFAYGTLFPAVVTYVDEVPVTYLTVGQLFDLADVEVLRGPQGVSFGRVTDGGNVLIRTREPANEPGGYARIELGSDALGVVDAALNIPLVKDRVLLRGAVEIGRRDGFTRNVATGQRLDGLRYESYRLGLKLAVIDRLSNTTTLAYQRTHDDGTSTILDTINPAALAANYAAAGLFPGVYGIDDNGDVGPFAAGKTPFTAAALVASRQASLERQQALGPRQVFQTAASYDRRTTLYVINRTQAELTDAVRLTNILGYTDVREDSASNYGASTGGVILGCHRSCGTGGGLPFYAQRQVSEELRLSGRAIAERLSWSLGGYADRQVPGRAFENDNIVLSILEQDVVQYARTRSIAGYGSVEYEIGGRMPGLKVNGGLRYTRDAVDSFNATYVRPLDAPGAAQTLATVLAQRLQGPIAAGGQNLPPATAAVVAATVAAATFQPIPHGECTSYGTLNGFASVFGAASCVRNRMSSSAVTWQGGVSYKRGAGPLVYARIAKGYRPGGVIATAPAGVDPRYDPERDVSIEAGVKARFALGGAPAEVNVAAYRDRYIAIQKSIVLPAAAGSVPATAVRNVADAVVRGVEVEGTIGPTRHVTLSGNFAYTDAAFDRDRPHDARACDPAQAVISGYCPFNRFAFTPRFRYSLTADYGVALTGGREGRIGVGARFTHQSSMSLSETSTLDPGSVEPPYGCLDLTLTWQNVLGRPIDLGFFMTNVTDRLYRIATNNLSQRSSIGNGSSVYAAPRMFGLSVKHRFGANPR